MKKRLLTGLVTGLFLAGMVGVASATFIVSDVGITSNSVTFTIDGDMTGYTSPVQPVTFSIEYFGNIFLSNNSYAANSWTSSVFDNESVYLHGNTGTWNNHDYTWSSYQSSLVDAVATHKTVTVSFGHDFLDTNAIGQLAFYWGHPLNRHTELARVDINNNPVPEPATMLLFGTGLAGLVGMRRRKNRK